MLNFILIARAATVEGIINTTIEEIVQPFIGLLMFVASAVFIYGVIEFISNNDDKKTNGKKHILWGIIGLFIMTAAAGLMWVIVRFWNNIQ